MHGMAGSTGATIVVERAATGFADRLRAYRVILDAVEVGRVRRGESLRVETNAGEHQLHLAIAWCRSRSIALSLAGGAEVRFTVRPGVSGLKMLVAPFYMTIGRSKYIRLDLVERS
jgi:hypothetical protein